MVGAILHAAELDMVLGAEGVVVRSRAASAREAGAPSANDIHQLVENDKLEAELDAVDRSFEDGLDAEQPGILGSKECCV